MPAIGHRGGWTMALTDTSTDRPARADLPAQSATFQHLDEPVQSEPASSTKTIPDDIRVGQAIVGGPAHGTPDPVAQGIRTPIQPTWFDKLEAFISKLSVRDNFWNSVCSLLWLPLAFWSGIRLKELPAGVQPGSFVAQAILPFRRFNRNWYRAMAGGALLANSEIAGGAYVFGICGADYTVVCKNLNYTFLRPCFGPAVYRMTARENIHELVKAGGEFNTVIDMEILQQGFRGDRDRRVGRCEATFHVTPKVHHKVKAMRKRP
jgi:acyl-coenzyme A thioesterase PaaI-like protein